MRLSKIKEDIAASDSNLKPHKTIGWNITVSNHAKERANLRFPKKSKTDWEEFHRNVLHGLLRQDDKKSGVHLIYSKSHNHAVIADVNRKNKSIHYVTLPPEGHSHATHIGDNKIMVESKIIIEFDIICTISVE